MKRTRLTWSATRQMGWRTRVVLQGALALGVTCSAVPQTRSLTELSMEELLQIEITSVSKRPEKLSRAPAAIFALTPDDIRRAGVQNIPEALRLVPGLQVARVDSHNWAISARGFNDTFANKLLVLRDGRSLYTPLFSGVFWDVQEVMLEDLERIEVVRGPGATLWGANAVNGVINILTKPAGETQGALGTVTVGHDLKHSAAARYGGAAGAQRHYRVYAKHTRYKDFETTTGGSAHDALQLGQAGFRFDDKSDADRWLTLQGDIYNGRENQIFLQPLPVAPYVMPWYTGNRVAGGNLLGRISQRLANGGELKLQAYYDHTSRRTAIFGEDRRTYDIEAQHRSMLGRHQEVTIGAGYRSTEDEIQNSPAITLNPASRRTDLWNIFLQDDIRIADTAHLILGSKLEYNDFTGREFQPGARFVWQPAPTHTVWASAARAVRTPARADHDIQILQPIDIPGVVGLQRGNPAVGAELLNAYEAGYRFNVRERLSVDLAVFYNDYRRLRSTEISPASLPVLFGLMSGAPIPRPIVISAQEGTKLYGDTTGAELALGAQLSRTWRARATYSYLEMDLFTRPDSLDFTGVNAAGRSPRHQAYLWSQHELTSQWLFDWRLRYVGGLPAVPLPSYTELDVRLAWRPNARWELSASGQNLLHSQHVEFVPSSIATPVAKVERGYYLQVRYAY